MVDTRVEDEVAAVTLTGAEILYCVQSGGPRNLTVDRIAAYAANPSTSDGRALGSLSLQWSDIFLASGAVLNFGGSNYTIAHSSGTLAFSGNIQTGGVAAIVSSVSITGTAPQLLLVDPGRSYKLDISGNALRVVDTTGGVSRLEVLSSGVINIPGSTVSTSTTTGALVVAGGVGVGGVLNVGGTATFAGSIALNVASAAVVINATSGNPSFVFSRAGTNQSFFNDDGSSLFIFSNGAGSTGVFITHGGSSWSAVSDARLPYKRMARDISDNLPLLDGYRLYENKVNGRLELFPKAQEVNALFPHIVHEGDNDPDYVPTGLNDARAWSMNYDRLGAIALAYARQHEARLAALEARLVIRN